jgi:hypothetical protein
MEMIQNKNKQEKVQKKMNVVCAGKQINLT